MNTVIVIAARNEALNIGPLVSKCKKYGKVIVAEGGSIDWTAELAISHGARVLTGLHCLRDAYLEGFRAALELGPTYIVQMDAGFSHSPDDIPTLLDGLKDAHMVIGSRFVPGGKMVNQPFRREMLSWCGSWLVRQLTGMPYRDLTSGFKAYRPPVIQAVLDQARDNPFRARMYDFQFEFTHRVHKMSYRIKEAPITYTGSPSRVNWRFIRAALKTAWRLR